MFFRILFFTLLAQVLITPPVMAENPSAAGPKDRCVVCGMFVAPYPNWVSAIQFNDGSNVYFDGPKDMFIFFFNPENYHAGTKNDDISGLYITEYYSTKMMKVEEVYFVRGSDVMGPMGGELVPIQGREKAEIFQRDHGGEKILQFDGNGLSEIAEKK